MDNEKSSDYIMKAAEYAQKRPAQRADPKKLVNVRDYEEEAEKRLSKEAWGYYRSGANYEMTLKLNETAYDQLQIRPRFFTKDLTRRSMRTKVLGMSVELPIGVAPTAMQRMAHPLGELATAKACEAMKTIYIMSTLSTSSIEEVALAAPGATKFFQLYIYKDRKMSLDLVRRAEKAGFKALVVTVDLPISGQRYGDMRNRFVLPSPLRLANIPENLGLIKKNDEGSGFHKYIAEQFDASLTWKDFEWFKKQTKLPVIAKGILTPEDAELAIAHGASAIVVSNHGARQLDTVPASIQVLPDIVKAVGNRCEVYIDGGVRSGVDILKALALGAKMVFFGRPVIWGLACNGENGVKNVLKIVRDELDIAMALSGACSVSDLSPAMICKATSFWAKL